MLPDYGKVWYDDNSTANILSLTNLVESTYSYTTHTNMMLFIGLYVFNPTYNTANSNVVTIVEENMVGSTIRQI